LRRNYKQRKSKEVTMNGTIIIVKYHKNKF
jgi:hypothetical protein